MSLRPPSTPRAAAPSLLPPPGSTPSALPVSRRKSLAPLAQSASAARRPTHDASQIQAQLDSLRAAMEVNNPARYESPIPTVDPSTFPLPASASPVESKSVNGRQALRKPSSLNLRATTSNSSSSISRPTTPVSFNPPTPAAATPRTPSHPRQSIAGRFASPYPLLPPSAAEEKKETLEIGDEVKMEVGGVTMEGTLRFLGEVDGKDGHWAGVELGLSWVGQGKNDGSVRGTQYFACPPLCGLFLPVSKISLAYPRPPLPSSRASAKFPTNLLPRDLSSPRPTIDSPASPSRPSAKDLRRRSLSPSKAPLSLATSQTTPRPKPRQSIGIPGPRKSIGPGGAGGAGGASSHSTPRAPRPPSSLREAPPPLPTSGIGFGRRSMTPSMSSGRGTPSTPSASRRLSVASHHSSHSSISGIGGGWESARPTTPSVRSVSRQSFALSLRSGAGSVASSHGGGEDGGEAREARERELREAREREREAGVLLEASERVGREMEARLGETERELRAAREKVARIETEREEADERRRRDAEMKDVVDEPIVLLTSPPRDDDDDEERQAMALRLAELERTVVDAQKREDVLRTASERAAREFENKSAAKEGEIERMREKLDDREEERKDLEGQIEKLRGAGQALCETYEERISEVEQRRMEAEERLVELEIQLESGGGAGAGSGLDQSTMARSAAELINAETALAEVEHLRTKVGTLEEQLEETREHLEAEVNDTRKRRQKSGEIELMLKKEVKTLRETIERTAKAEARTAARIEELEDALAESQNALENERAEVEGLRHDAHGTAHPSLADDLARARQQIAALTREAARNADLVSELRDDLRQAETEIQASHQRGARQGSLEGPDGQRLLASTPVQQPTQDTPNLLSSPSSSRKRDSIASSSGSRRSIGGPKDDAAAMREQIVGLKVIIATLTEENGQLGDRNKQLMTESQELRDAQRALEATVENLMNEMGSGAPSLATATSRAASHRLSNVPLQREVDELQRKLADAEKRSDREIKALHLEVTELESLVESKIYREDELELELERFKKLASGRPLVSLANGNGARGLAASPRSGDELECEMCSEKGHDVDSCPIFGGSSSAGLGKTASSSLASSPPTSANGAEFCDDCEEYGHSLEACPMANEIF